MSDVLSETQDEAAYLRCQVQLLTDEVERLRLSRPDGQWFWGPMEAASRHGHPPTGEKEGRL